MIKISEQEEAAVTVVERQSTSPGDERLRHDVFRDFEKIVDLRLEWDRFVESNGGDLYSSFDWCRIWWRYYGDGRRLEIHVFREGDQWAGVIPIFREELWLGPAPLRVVRLLGCDHSTTTCGLVIDPNHLPGVIEALMSRLAGGRWDLIHLGPLPGYFEHRKELERLFARESSSVTVHGRADDGPHIVFDLPESIEAYLATLTKKERSNIRLGHKRLEAEHAVSETMVAAGELEQWFPFFIEQHQRQWRTEGQLGHFADWPRAVEFHQELASTLANRGRLWLLRLEADGQAIGFQYNYRFGSRLHWLLGSRDSDARWDSFSPGRILNASVTRRAIAEGVTQIDGLKGMYPYKLRLGGKVLGLQSISIVRRGFMPAIKIGWSRLAAKLLHLLYYRIWFGRVAPRLPIRRRGLWKLWIRSRI